jgi:hypothetical protein
LLLHIRVEIRAFSVVRLLNKYYYMKILLTSVFLLFLTTADCQNGSNILKYKDGNNAFIKLVSNYINSNIPLDSSSNSLYSNLNITIDKDGKIKSINILTMNDSSLSKVFYDAFMLTNERWINPTGENQIFNIEIVGKYLADYKYKKNPFQFYSEYYENGKQKQIVRYGALTMSAHPSSR